MALSESALQMTLARDPNFLTRLSYLLVQQARIVKDEALDTPQHLARSNYATSVINNPTGMAPPAAIMVTGGPNLIGTVTLEDTGPATSATDAAILAQVAAFWTALSGADSQVPPP
ncbi:MAG TPA: hypothetical protein VKE26_26295 [Xanthobacteraceae bacterium]|nr:hypothetical protein [Xanthobacteraceae bacterium]